MITTQLSDNILINDRNVLIRVIFYLELVIKKGIQLSDNELNILSLFVDNDDKESVIQLGIDKEFIKKIYVTVGTVMGTSALALLKKITGGAGGNAENPESESG